jgi:hypothetical protein
VCVRRRRTCGVACVLTCETAGFLWSFRDLCACAIERLMAFAASHIARAQGAAYYSYLHSRMLANFLRRHLGLDADPMAEAAGAPLRRILSRGSAVAPMRLIADAIGSAPRVSDGDEMRDFVLSEWASTAAAAVNVRLTERGGSAAAA